MRGTLFVLVGIGPGPHSIRPILGANERAATSPPPTCSPRAGGACCSWAGHAPPHR
ncbi:hypothetical protein [Nonomuraea dietziae]|uniref:hypothetical protein n=1 Tax=Nonomuraea dietziae TaxID=65515 RepID=UPI0031D28228